MKKILFTLGVVASMLMNAQKNTFLNADFWKSKPSVEAVKAEVAKGNSPSEFNASSFDAVALAINNGAPLETIKYLVEQDGNSVDKLTHDGRLYLHWAAMSGNDKVVEYLISKGSKVNQLDTKGLTPASFAAMFGVNNPKVYDLLFAAGVNPKEKYKDGANILLLSIGNDTDGSLLKLFQSKGLKITDTDDQGNSAFDYAATFGNLDILKSLQKQEIKAHDLALINAAQGTRRSSNGLPVFQYLVEEVKVNPKAVSADGSTVLHIVARKPKQADIVSYFIAKGVDANKVNKDGDTALMMATAGQDAEVLKLLIAQTKDINAVNTSGESALTFAVKSGNTSAIETLLANKADAKVVDAKGNNLGYYWVQSYRSARPGQKDNFVENMNLLQKAGVNLATAQKDGSTLLHLAAAKNDLNLFKKLEALKIDVNALDKDHMTVLHKVALIAKDDALLKYVAALGVDKSIKTEFDETAYDLASENEILKSKQVNLQFLK
ncbi:ankyrin repeat domain-containing protein [Elizabethkingia sp. JS20170427COW]|uniref:ankyrin repeat domain-containing protein n=1 Tax=Elizabethkingia sp. JS20170427COW TaxID=2583851 RepID=UPI001110197A|nr:ankyrin repeat domain-containing protein [Elizabethkingia sp. JS20170427COW]QCX52693.1 ankyrin repeat domain-containing protein [Elizabethkingia sp. JS20170427COW]